MNEKIIDSVKGIVSDFYDNPESMPLQIWQETDGGIYATILTNKQTVELYELIHEEKLHWLFIGEQPKFWVNPEEVRILYETTNEQ